VYLHALIQETCIKQLNKLIGLDLQNYLHGIKKIQVKINAAVCEMTTNAERFMGVLGAMFEQGDESHEERRALVTVD
jgi:hypothetical protein